MFETSLYQRVLRRLTPPVDIYEGEDRVIVMAEIPGVTKDRLRIEVVDRELTIEGQRPMEHEGSFIVHESTRCDYFRAFRLAPSVDTANIEASLSDGVLTLILPKKRDASRYEVPIQTE